MDAEGQPQKNQGAAADAVAAAGMEQLLRPILPSQQDQTQQLPALPALAATASPVVQPPVTRPGLVTLFAAVSAIVSQQEAALGCRPACQYLLYFQDSLDPEKRQCHAQVLQQLSVEGRGAMVAEFVRCALESRRAERGGDLMSPCFWAGMVIAYAASLCCEPVAWDSGMASIGSAEGNFLMLLNACVIGLCGSETVQQRPL